MHAQVSHINWSLADGFPHHRLIIDPEKEARPTNVTRDHGH